MKLMGWKFVGLIPYKIKRCIFIVAPHTSRWDFLFLFFSIKIHRVKQKLLLPEDQKSFFCSRVINACEGELYHPNDPVQLNRLMSEMRNQDLCRLTFFPKGGLSKSQDWDLNFYHMATELKVPIIMLSFDYKNKWVKYHLPFKTSIDQDRDIAFMKRYFATCNPKHRSKGMHYNYP